MVSLGSLNRRTNGRELLKQRTHPRTRGDAVYVRRFLDVTCVKDVRCGPKLTMTENIRKTRTKTQNSRQITEDSQL